MAHPCPRCGKTFPKVRSLSAHKSHCGKPGRYTPAGWNKGKTKATDPGVARNAEGIRQAYRSGKVTKGPLSPEHKRKISETCLRKSQEGTWHNSFSRARTHLYKGVAF